MWIWQYLTNTYFLISSYIWIFPHIAIIFIAWVVDRTSYSRRTLPRNLYRYLFYFTYIFRSSCISRNFSYHILYFHHKGLYNCYCHVIRFSYYTNHARSRYPRFVMGNRCCCTSRNSRNCWWSTRNVCQARGQEIF